MGLFNKIKNILFEDDEVDDIPVYTKEEKTRGKEQAKTHEGTKEDSKVFVKETSLKREVIQVDTTKPPTNIKRDIDLGSASVEDTMVIPQAPVEDIVVPKLAEKKESPFLSFDEAEFERLNSHVIKNEDKIKERKTLTGFKKGSLGKEEKDRYSKDSSKRPFRPSPVISPVYGILDKNYTKDDIVDKMDGLKREVIKPAIRKEIQSELVKDEETFEVNVDSVRKKAFGALEELEKRALDVEEQIPYVEDFSEDLEIPLSKKTLEDKETYTDNEIEVPLLEEDPILENLKKDILPEEESVESILDKEPIVEEDSSNDVDQSKKMRMLDDMEKTSTLQILDDIEKELNAIKPISKDYNKENIEEEKEALDNNDTLENDLFDLIDSMYEEGEEEDDD